MKPTGALVLAMALATGLPAQETERPERLFQYNGNGQVYFASGVCQHGYKHLGIGGGGEGFVWRGLTVGGDLGYHQFVDDVNFGLASLHVGYHFVDRQGPKKLDPFVNFSPLGAYFAGGGFGSAAGVGGGLNYWFNEKIGLRTEVRYQALGADESLIVFRLGVNFR